VELWRIWSGVGELFNVHTKRFSVDSLTPELIRELDEREIRIDTVEGYESVDQYQYVVRK